MCSPSRAAIQTGLNPHRAGFAGVANFDPGFPGWTMEISPDIQTLPEVLRAAGYATFGVGKWHLTRDAAMHDGAPRDSWPIQRGFDRFYGILEGWTNLHHPHRLVRDNSPVDVDVYPDGYYFTDDITDHAAHPLTGTCAHFWPGKSIPFGSVRFIRPNAARDLWIASRPPGTASTSDRIMRVITR